MNHYQHILLAVDFSDQSHEIAQKANNLARFYRAALSIVHIIDYMPFTNTSYGPIIPLTTDLNNELIQSARIDLTEQAMIFGIPKNRQFLGKGAPALEIVAAAQKHHADLIVVGSHGHSGLRTLLGATASSVLHHAKCDVLAVRIQEK